MERLPERVAAGQDHMPVQPGLKHLETHLLEQGIVVIDPFTPHFIGIPMPQGIVPSPVSVFLCRARIDEGSPYGSLSAWNEPGDPFVQCQRHSARPREAFEYSLRLVVVIGPSQQPDMEIEASLSGHGL